MWFYLPKEYVVDLLPNESPKSEKLAVDTVQDGFEEIPFSRIFRVEQLEQLQDELLIDHPFTDGRLKVGTFEETQEELVDELQVRPARLQRRVVFFGIKVGILARRQRSEQVGRYLKITNINNN